MNGTNDKRPGWQKKLISILVVLLIISLLVLAGRFIYLNFFRDQQNSTVTVPENIIENPVEKAHDIDKKGDSQERSGDSKDGAETNANMNESVNGLGAEKNNNSQESVNGSDKEDSKEPEKETVQVKAPSIELDKIHTEYNERFDAEGMLPGDVVTKYYCVKVHHDYDVKVYFEARVKEETKHLGDVLEVKVTDVTEGANRALLLAEDTFSKADQETYSLQLKENKDDYTRKYYRIDVSLDTSVGNPYQEAELTADFKWYVTDEEYKAMVAKNPIIPGITDPEISDVPKTGDLFDKTMWVVFLGSALLLAASLVAKKR